MPVIVVAVRSLVLGAQRNENPSVASDVPARAVAVAGALFWGFLFFGLIDLLVPFQDQEFYDSYLLETGWGLFFAVLVAVPLIASAMQPRCLGLASQVAVASAAVAAPAIFTPAPGQFLAAVGLLATCLAQRAFIRRAATPTRETHRGPRPWRLRPRQLLSGTLVLVAAVAGVAYAADMIAAGRAGCYPVDHTWGLDHWPMQASLGLCIPAVAAIAVLRLPCWQVAAWTAAIAAMWLGVMSVLYPQHARQPRADSRHRLRHLGPPPRRRVRPVHTTPMAPLGRPERPTMGHLGAAVSGPATDAMLQGGSSPAARRL